jgi:hypothetical protein
VSRRARLWPAVLAASAIAALAVTHAGAGGPLRALVALWFLAVCPGMAVVRLLELPDVLAELVLAIAVSLSLETIVSTTLVYAGGWSPRTSLDVFAGIALAGAAVQAAARRREAHA